MTQFCRRWKVLVGSMLILLVALGAGNVNGQTAPAPTLQVKRALPPHVEQVLQESEAAAHAELASVERGWRAVFRESRSRQRLKGFVDETLDVFEKLQQVYDFAANTGMTETRIRTLFRKRILDEEAVCRSMEQTLAGYCRVLDEQDQSLLIKLKIDRDVTRTTLSRSIIDPARYKQPIKTAANAAVSAAVNDMTRTIAALITSEVISAGVKQVARDYGVMPGEPGSLGEFFSGLIVEIGVGLAVDAATDPSGKMVSDLENQLAIAERSILDGTATSPGFITTLRRVTQERLLARRKLVEAEFSK